MVSEKIALKKKNTKKQPILGIEGQKTVQFVEKGVAEAGKSLFSPHFMLKIWIIR
jgi:hypothetical protein